MRVIVGDFDENHVPHGVKIDLKGVQFSTAEWREAHALVFLMPLLRLQDYPLEDMVDLVVGGYNLTHDPYPSLAEGMRPVLDIQATPEDKVPASPVVKWAEKYTVKGLPDQED